MALKWSNLSEISTLNYDDWASLWPQTLRPPLPHFYMGVNCFEI